VVEPTNALLRVPGLMLETDQHVPGRLEDGRCAGFGERKRRQRLPPPPEAIPSTSSDVRFPKRQPSCQKQEGGPPPDRSLDPPPPLRGRQGVFVGHANTDPEDVPAVLGLDG